MADPLVSIGLPTYNGAPYLAAAIQSILQQTYPNIEILLCDDDSRDDTWEIVTQCRDPRLQPIRNAARKGLVGNWNACLARAHGSFFTLMHQDDLMHAENIARKVAFLTENPTVGFVHSDIHRIDSDGNISGGHWLPHAQGTSDTVWESARWIPALLRVGNFVCMPSVLARRELLTEIGAFEPTLPFTPDVEMWLRLAQRAPVGYLAEPLLSYRRHEAQETQKFGNGREVWEFGRAVRCFLQKVNPPESREWESVARAGLAKWAFDMAKWRAKQKNIRASVGYSRVVAYLRWRGLPK